MRRTARPQPAAGGSADTVCDASSRMSRSSRILRHRVGGDPGRVKLPAAGRLRPPARAPTLWRGAARPVLGRPARGRPEPLPAAVDPLEAMRPDAPRVRAAGEGGDATEALAAHGAAVGGGGAAEPAAPDVAGPARGPAR